MSFIGALSLRILVRSPTLISLDFPLATLIDIAGKRKQLLTYTQKINKSKA
jgi:ABC-type molybdate transport system ATPase subunit